MVFILRPTNVLVPHFHHPRSHQELDEQAHINHPSMTYAAANDTYTPLHRERRAREESLALSKLKMHSYQFMQL